MPALTVSNLARLLTVKLLVSREPILTQEVCSRSGTIGGMRARRALWGRGVESSGVGFH